MTRARRSLFGPLVWWELTRLARRGHAARTRVLLLYSLLVAALLFAFGWSYWVGRVPLFSGTVELEDAHQAAHFAGRLALALLEAQLLLVALITPAYAAAAVSEEKDRGTLALLLTTELSDREIVWGKAVARAVFVLAAVAAGVPVLVLTLLLGGVTPDFLAAGYAITAGTVLLCVGVGVSAGCHAPDGRAALVRAYGQWAAFVGCVLVPPFVVLSPFAMLFYYHLELERGVLQGAIGFGYPLGQCVIACILLVEATRGIRRPGPTAGPQSPTAYPEPPRGRPEPVVFGPSDPEPPPLPPVHDADPVLWKERHAGRTPPLPVLDRPARLFGALVAVVAVALFVGGGWLLVERALRTLDPAEAMRVVSRGHDAGVWAGVLLVAAGLLAAGLYLLPLAVGVTGCVAGERFRGTLDSLLAAPLDRRRVLRSKVRAHAERGLVFAGGAAAALGSAFGTEIDVRTGVAALAAFAAGVGLVVGFGAWLSVRCATPVLAFRLCSPAVLVAVSLPALAWWAPTREFGVGPAELLAWGAAACVLLGAAFWWRAGAELERGA